jgi:hypothetical protein
MISSKKKYARIALSTGTRAIIIIPSLAPISWNDLKRNESPNTKPTIPLNTRFEIWSKDKVRLIPAIPMIAISIKLAITILSMLTCIAPILLVAFANAYAVIDQQKAVASAAISPM